MICFFFNDTATTEIYTLSLHDALPIWSWYRDDIDREMWSGSRRRGRCRIGRHREGVLGEGGVDREA